LDTVVMSVSQPSAGLFVQCAKPWLHVTPHVPFVHDATPFVLAHTIPQPPQWLTFEAVSVSQPSASLDEQCAQPLLQLNWQTPFTQVTWAELALPH
jgi:hypothetical protein